MPYITSVERIGREQGLEEGLKKGREEGRREGQAEGLREGLLLAMEMRLQHQFGAEGLQLMPQIRQVQDPERLRALFQRLLENAPTLDEVRQACA
jgi:hypothetical protein